MTSLSPGEIRALLWISETHPDTLVTVTEFKDVSGAGWVLAKSWVTSRGSSGKRQKLYVLSPTGAIWDATVSLGLFPWDDMMRRIKMPGAITALPQVRDSDYQTA